MVELAASLQVKRRAIDRMPRCLQQIWDGLPSLSSPLARDRSLLSCEYCARCGQSRRIGARCWRRTGQGRNRAALDRCRPSRYQPRNRNVLYKLLARETLGIAFVLALRSTNHHLTNHERLPHSNLDQALGGRRSAALPSLVDTEVFVEAQVFGHRCDGFTHHPRTVIITSFGRRLTSLE